MTDVFGFPPLSRPDARILILGSMPGRESLARQRYYAHPRNAFWPIMSELFALAASDYGLRASQLTRKGVAVWDVLKTCHRTGSLDSNISDRSMVTNDFRIFFAEHPAVCRVFFNGAKAESVYRKHVLPGLGGGPDRLMLQRLPSTSPAHAGMTLAEKKSAWRVMLDDGVK
ncbi:MAG: DNA-deoxyinosine glycosylase [Xanthomonadales bacterium]|nr:DNA-deoxyinosine glycosylase [Gammaproteobacteria bacterium]MBT8054286.1 DNA-deoxyinosine glycosylase [Gammaproteobacteria bacterium]NND57521.1 DNA-deoxyinosine glycosylase [Xanthomonadales bacterium]NNK51245.1 DNA-deoxyinosine glycosylase [Xanthomonadales bacterium]